MRTDSTSLAHSLAGGEVHHLREKIAHTDLHGPTKTDPVILAALDYLLDIKDAAGGRAAAIQDLELLLDANTAVGVVIKARDDLVGALQEPRAAP